MWESSKMEELMDKVRIEIFIMVYYFVHLLFYLMALLTFEGKMFYVDGKIQEEGEFKYDMLNG